MKKILYVEDDQLLSRLYTQKLGEAGFDVVGAADGLAAIKKLEEYTPDLIVLDLLMPKMTGADVLKFMRQHDHLRSIPVVVFSNSFLSDLTEQVTAAKVEMTLVKSSVTPTKLIAALREVLAHPPSHLAPLAPEPGRANALTAKATAEPTPEATSAEAVPTAVKPKESETDFRTRVQREFFERTPALLASIRKLCSGFLEADDAASEKRRLEELARKMGFLSQMTALAGCHDLAQLASALEALVIELHDHPAKLNDSTRNTVVTAVAFLLDRLDTTSEPQMSQPRPASLLVVDDDAVSNRALVLALARAKLDTDSTADPFDALKKIEQKAYDLVLLDVEMPGMTGITLCEKMRALPNHRRTPVIFVTSLKDFKTRARTLLSGGTDIITKPILPLELTVKALTQLMQSAPK